jgi:hypothetical protein
MMRQVWCLCVVALFLLPCGCTSSSSPHKEKTYPVSGTVTFDGEPLADGEINFLGPELGLLDVAHITNGKFEGVAKAGNRRVEIKAFKEKAPEAGAPTMPGADQPTQVNYIPSCYNTDSKLTAQVTEQGPNQFKFDLTSDCSGASGSAAGASEPAAPEGGAAPEK